MQVGMDVGLDYGRMVDVGHGIGLLQVHHMGSMEVICVVQHKHIHGVMDNLMVVEIMYIIGAMQDIHGMTLSKVIRCILFAK